MTWCFAVILAALCVFQFLIVACYRVNECLATYKSVVVLINAQHVGGILGQIATSFCIFVYCELVLCFWWAEIQCVPHEIQSVPVRSSAFS